MYEIDIPDFLKESVDDIHKRMINNAPANINNIEGDLFWDNTRPCAEEIARIKNISLVNLLKSRFPQTAIDKDLDLCGEEEGVPRKDADYAIQKIKIVGNPGTNIYKDRIVCTPATEERKSIEFLILEDVNIQGNGEITVNAKCTKPGSIGNVSIGEINILAKSISGVTSISNIEIVKYGVNIEDDNSYRERILQKARTPATSGNKYHYLNWAMEVTGVGAAKIFSGAGVVKVVIVDSNKHAATKQLIEDVYEHIDEVRPILAGSLTVVSAAEKKLNITAKVKTLQGLNLGEIQQEFIELLKEYLKSISFKTEYISIAKIGNLLLNVYGVLDYADLKIDNLASNISLKDEEIAVLGNVELGVM
ncbi:baseplate J/gp47 family protein [Clostridium botulinum]|nr:baseplate J/gp47 family protein [Clostridium botulinum]NFO92314.1 baseplate J/gp47 family protein [Clostridium botulinum]